VPTDDSRDLSRSNPKGGDRGRSAGRYEERRERVIDNGDDISPVSDHHLPTVYIESNKKFDK
jgi:hypothetical protein